jgi:hypothetical protein
MVIPMVEKLYFKENKSNKPWLIFLGIVLFLLVFGFSIYGSVSNFFQGLGKTAPEKVFNNTHGEFEIIPHPYMSFQEYYQKVKPAEEKSLLNDYSDLKLNYTLEVPKLEFNYKFYDYEPEYYDYCTGKKLEINFSNSKTLDFKFNYKEETFNYKITLYPDLYYFSSNLKNQDCYFGTDKYTEGFLEDPYNNYFIDAVSKDFISLKNKGYSNDEIVEIATLFVQSIPYGTDSSDLNRYPYETFYEDEGNCLDKSLILVGILKNLNYTSYIILGESDYEYHALVGIVCEDGNIEYTGKDICFVETTIYTPISSEIEIDIEDYIQTSEGDKVYRGVNYGKDLINLFDTKYFEVENIESQLDSIESDLIEIEGKMCKTDCVVCEEGLFGVEFVNWDKSASIFRCYDANKFNSLLKGYNSNIDDYNLLVEDWYKSYYDLEKLMFGNVELIERD